MSIVFNNAVSDDMAYFWSARSLQSLAMISADASEVPVLAMILVGGGAVSANREDRLVTGHGGVIF